jgi:serine protease Do
MKLRFSLVVMLCVGRALLCGPTVRGDVVTAQSESKTKRADALREVFRAVVAGANHSTVTVQAVLEPGNDPQQVAYGTIVSADGYVLTKASEVLGRKQLQVVGGESPSTVHDAVVVGWSEPLDLAMLKIAAKGLVPVEWAEGKSDHVDVGEWVAVAGPVGMEETDPVAVGVVSVGRRRIVGEPGFLGVERGDAPDHSGSRMVRVLPGTAAEKAGIQAGDVVTAIDGKPVKSAEDLLRVLQGYRPGDVVMLAVRRGTTMLALTATLGVNRREEAETHFSMMDLLGGLVSKRATDFSAVIQHDTVIRPVDCGGPLVDLSGKVIGINIARAGRTETYALPADVVEGVLGALENGKLAPVNANRPSPVTTAPTTRPGRGE